jgi:hypothetical protein
VITDGWGAYRGLPGWGYGHEPHNQREARDAGQDLDELLPGVHRVASLAKRWLLGTHQGGVDPAHLAAYLDESTFRFNRRRSRSRGLVSYRVLELAVGPRPCATPSSCAPRDQSPSPSTDGPRHTAAAARRAWTDSPPTGPDAPPDHSGYMDSPARVPVDCADRAPPGGGRTPVPSRVQPATPSGRPSGRLNSGAAWRERSSSRTCGHRRPRPMHHASG